jgi:hypothetical protein
VIFILAQPFCAFIGVRNAICQYREEKQPGQRLAEDSALSRIRSE